MAARGPILAREEGFAEHEILGERSSRQFSPSPTSPSLVTNPVLGDLCEPAIKLPSGAWPKPGKCPEGAEQCFLHYVFRVGRQFDTGDPQPESDEFPDPSKASGKELFLGFDASLEARKEPTHRVILVVGHVRVVWVGREAVLGREAAC